MEDYQFFNFLLLINLSQQFCILKVLFANKPPGLGLQRGMNIKNISCYCPFQNIDYLLTLSESILVTYFSLTF
jgi:hypothetical protein